MNVVDTRQRLVETMSESIRERGIGATSMSDVLERADVSAGSMYHFFPGGKDELAAAAVREVGMQLNGVLRSVVAGAPSVSDGATVFFSSLIVDFEREGYRYGCPIGVPSTEASGTNEAVREAGAEVFDAWVRTIAEALEHEGWSSVEAASTARLMVAVYEGSSTLSRTFRDTAVVTDALEALRTLLTRRT